MSDVKTHGNTAADLAAQFITRLRGGEVDAALIASGYTDNGLEWATFDGMTESGQARYKISYVNIEGEQAAGFVFVSWDSAEGGFRAEW